MPYTTGKLKGQLTSTELRRLVKEHNKLYSIKIPKGTSYEEIIQLIKDNGYNVDHKNQRLTLAMKKLERVIKLPAPPVKKTKEELDKIKKEKEGKANVKDTEAYKKRKEQVEKLKKLKESRDKSKTKLEQYITKPFKIKSMVDNILKDKDYSMDNPDTKKLKTYLEPSENQHRFEIEMKIEKKDTTDTIFLNFTYKKWRNLEMKYMDKVTDILRIKKKKKFELKKPVPTPVKIDDKNKPPSNIAVVGKGKYKKYTIENDPDKIVFTGAKSKKDKYFNKKDYDTREKFNELLKKYIGGGESEYPKGQVNKETLKPLTEAQFIKVKDLMDNRKKYSKGLSIGTYNVQGFGVRMEIYTWVRGEDKRSPVVYLKYIESKEFKLDQKKPKPVKIDDSKKPPSNTMKIDDTNKWKLIPVKSIDATNPLTKKDYEDIRDIPAEEIFKNIEANKEVDFYPWTSYFASAIFTYAYILKENNNDCSLSMDLLYKIGKEKNTTNKKITNPNSNLKKYAKEIAESIIRCWKKGQVVCIPISIVQGGKKKNTHSYHANMLVFNSYRMEAEHFEPHGRFYQGQGKFVLDNSTGIKKWKYNVVQGINFKPAIQTINTEIKKLLKTTPIFTNINNLKKGFVYKSPLDICPPKSQYESFKGFQVYDRYRDNTTRQFNGVVITEMGGYCAMWSLFYLATRLKTLKSPTTEITEKLNNMFMTKYGENTPEGDTRKKMVELMRGMSKFSFEKNMEMVSKGLITKEDLTAFMGIKGTGYNHTLYTKYNDAMKEFTKGEWATFTS